MGVQFSPEATERNEECSITGQYVDLQNQQQVFDSPHSCNNTNNNNNKSGNNNNNNNNNKE